MAEIPKNPVKIYPDITDILRRKEERRKELAQRPIEEKLATVERMKKAAKLIKNSRKITK